MKKVSGSLIFTAFVLLGTISPAQDEPVKVTRLTEHLYLLSTDQGTYTTNTIAMVGDDGILLVDTQAEKDAQDLKRAVESFGKGPPRYIINTHRHVEHVGGNAAFGDSPIVIAHELVPEKLRSGSYLFNEFPKSTFPDITIDSSLTLYFNGERIRVLAFPGSHDDNEIVVYFTGSKVVHLSSIVNGFNFPSVDSDGDVLKFPELVEKAMDQFPKDVTIVSGHNSPGSWQDLIAYRDMLVQTTAIVRKGLADGKDLAALQREKVLEKWERYAGSYVSTDDWIEYLVEGLQNQHDSKKKVFEPIYYAWKEGGAEAAIGKYFELKRDHPGEYRFDEANLLVIGNKLLGSEHTEAALAFFEASLKEYPDSKYNYYLFYKMADAQNRLGQTEPAIENCEKSLKLNPDFEGASKLLESLRANQ